MPDHYTLMLDTLNIITTTYDISHSNTDFFEEMLLKLAGIEEKPQGCKFSRNIVTNGENCNFDLVISAENASAFVATLNLKFPALNAIYLPESSIELNGKLARFIRMNCAAIQQHLLPLIEADLKANPEMAQPYQKFLYNNVVNQLAPLFAKQGIRLTATGCLEEAICYIAQQHLKSLPASQRFFDGSSTETDTAQTAIDSKMIPEITTKSISFGINQPYLWSTDLLITPPIEQAEKIVAYFNSILPDSAKIAEKQEAIRGSNILYSRITINHKVLMKKSFLNAIEDYLNKYGKDRLNKYRVQPGTPSQNTSVTMMNLGTNGFNPMGNLFNQTGSISGSSYGPTMRC